MEQITFLTHDTYFLKRMNSLSFGRWFFFSAWITEYLYKQYGGELRSKYLEAEGLDLEEVLAFLWYAVEKANVREIPLDGPFELDAELWNRYMDPLQNDEIYSNLDQTHTPEMGQASLISAFYNTLSFIPNRSTQLVAGTAFLPMDIIDCILTNDLGLSYEESTIEHPMYMAELAIQDRMIDHLHSGAVVGKAQKDLFRM